MDRPIDPAFLHAMVRDWLYSDASRQRVASALQRDGFFHPQKHPQEEARMNGINASDVSSNPGEQAPRRDDTGDGDSTQHHGLSRKNVSDGERAVTGVAGAALAIYGMRHGGLLGWLGVVAGTALVARGVTGRCPVYAAFGIDHGHRGDELSEESSRSVSSPESPERPQNGSARRSGANVEETGVEVEEVGSTGEHADSEAGSDTETWEPNSPRNV